MSEKIVRTEEMFTVSEGYFHSSDKMHDIFYRVYRPAGEPKAIVQIAHGMCEYIGRYDGFMSYLAEKGYIVCGNDHLGHGQSVYDDEELGYFADKEGWQKVVLDMHRMTTIVRRAYPDKPFFVFGHSMGSFLTRAYITKFGRTIDGAVICGTSGGVDGAPMLLTVCDGIKAAKGGYYRSERINKMAFGAYLSEIPDPRTPYDWISRDEEIVDKYAKDKLCTFIFTINGFENLTKVLWYVSNEKWFDSYPKELPTYLIAGSADPVGDYGKGVLRVYNKLRTRDADMELKIYSGARHELLNEINRGEVYEDVLAFYEPLVEKWEEEHRAEKPWENEEEQESSEGDE